MVEISFGSRGNKLYLFRLFGIHVLSELSFPLSPFISSRMHVDPEICVSLVRGTSETLFFEIRPYFINFPLFVILKFTKKTLSLVSATSDVLSSLSAHGVLNCIVSLVRDTCVIGIFLSLDPTSFISDAY